MKKYLSDGTEVKLVKEIADGWLVKRYRNTYIDDEGELIENDLDGLTIFIDRAEQKIYNEPLTERLNNEVMALREEAKSLREAISNLKKVRKDIESGIVKIK